MTAHQLATQLRIQQHAEIDAVSDSEIIDEYNTCTHCGVNLVDAFNLTRIIQVAKTVDQFFKLRDRAHRH